MTASSRRVLRHTLLITAVLWAGVAAAEPAPGLYTAGSTRFLVIDAASETSFRFTLDVGVADGQLRCAEGDVSCLAIAGVARAASPPETFSYIEPGNEGRIRFAVSGGDIIISDATGPLGSGSGNARQLPWIAGVYEAAAPDLPGAIAGGQIEYFQTPSGNIGCAASLGSAPLLRCDMSDLQPSYKTKPADCEFDWGSAFELSATGPGEVICHSDTARNADAAKIAYGRTLKIGGFECLSERTGLTCQNAAGHGFTLSRARQRIF